MMTPKTLEKLSSKARAPEAVSTFIKKTFELLEDQKFPDIVDWNDEGTAIVIKKPTEFGQKVLPTYFKHNNLTSFVRQLNMYDFHKRRTQKYDHVYYHDLFQKDKKHLLAEIRRKNQDTTLASIQKAIETLESAQGSDKSELSANTGVYENQLLKKLNKDALSRIATLENKVKDLTIQNQALFNQSVHQNQKEDVLVSFLASFMKKKGITLDQLPKALNNQFNLPSFELDSKNKAFIKEIDGLKRESDQSSEASGAPVNVGDFFNFSDDLSNSTEISPSSPLSKAYTESEKPSANDDGLLGKRIYGESSSELQKEDLWGPQKLVKRDSFGLFQEGNSFMANEPKEEVYDMKVKKFDSFFDLFGNHDNQNNMSLDFFNFS